jgi:ATP-dependent Lhr-like helicase
LRAACARLAAAAVIGLDVETTLHSRALCLVQVATAEEVFLIDALEVADLAPLADVLADSAVVKLIHNAAFEREVLGRHGIRLENVVDTLVRSRAARPGVEGGHSLAAVCARELGIELDKSEQTSDWTRRPLSAAQVAYAALDAEVLLTLNEVFGGR